MIIFCKTLWDGFQRSSWAREKPSKVLNHGLPSLSSRPGSALFSPDLGYEAMRISDPWNGNFRASCKESWVCRCPGKEIPWNVSMTSNLAMSNLDRSLIFCSCSISLCSALSCSAALPLCQLCLSLAASVFMFGRKWVLLRTKSRDFTWVWTFPI